MQNEAQIIIPKDVLTFKEAAEYTGFSERYLHQLTANQLVPFSKPNGKNIFFSRAKLDAWLLTNQFEPKSDQNQPSRACVHDSNTQDNNNNIYNNNIIPEDIQDINTDIEKDKEIEKDKKKKRTITLTSNSREKKTKETETKTKESDENTQIPSDLPKRNPPFVVPTKTEISSYFLAELNSTQNSADAFYDYYESCGWMVGKKKMQRWKAAASGWVRREKEYNARPSRRISTSVSETFDRNGDMFLSENL